MGRSCRGICQMMEAESVPNKMRYKLGHKRCSYCGIFFSTRETRCPCCKAALRTKARGKKKEDIFGLH